MTGAWRSAGRVPGGPIGSVAVGEGGLIACGSLAGLAVSTDAGATWHWPLPGRIGPFVADVAVAGGPGDGLVVASAPTGLARSRDAGDGWELLELDALQVALLGDGRIAAVLRDGGLATIDEHGATVGGHASGAPSGITTLALAGQEGGAWAIADGRIVRSTGLDGPWADIDLPTGLEPVDLAVTSEGALMAVGADGSLHRRDPGTGAWMATPGVAEVALVGVARSARAAVALLPDAVLVSVDEGRRWHRVGLDGTPLSVGVAPGGSVGVIGLTDGRVLAIDLPGESVRSLTSPPSALVTTLAGEGDRLVVAGFLGAAASADGSSWEWLVRPPSLGEATPIASGRVLVAGPDGIFDASGARVADAPSDTIVALASDAASGSLAVTDGTSIWTWGGGDGGARQAQGWVNTPVAADERVVALAFGSPGTAAVPSLVAGTVDAAGAGTVWLLHGSRWHRLASGTTVARVIRLATLPGPRGVYAAIGDTLLRPAAVGELVLAPEWPSGRGEPIHGLAATRRESGDVIAVMTARRVYVSYDGGYGWAPHEMPSGPPATAMGFRGRAPLQVVVARLAGELFASTID